MAEIKVSTEDKAELEDEVEAGQDDTPEASDDTPETAVAGFSIHTDEEEEEAAQKRAKARKDLAEGDDDAAEEDAEAAETATDFYQQYLEFATSYAVMFGGKDALQAGNFIDPSITRNADTLTLSASRKFPNGKPEMTTRIRDTQTGKESYFHFSQKAALVDVGAPGSNMSVQQAFLVTSAARSNEDLRGKPLRAQGNQYNQYMLVMMAKDKSLFQGAKPLQVLHEKQIKAQTPKDIRKAVEREIKNYKQAKGLGNKKQRQTEIQKFGEDIRTNRDQVKAKIDQIKQGEAAKRQAQQEAARQAAEQAAAKDKQTEGGDNAGESGGEAPEEEAEDEGPTTSKPFKSAAAGGAAAEVVTADQQVDGAQVDQTTESKADVAGADAAVVETVDEAAQGDDVVVAADVSGDDDAGGAGTEVEGSYADLVDGGEVENTDSSTPVKGKTEAKGDFGDSATGDEAEDVSAEEELEDGSPEVEGAEQDEQSTAVTGSNPGLGKPGA